MKKIFFLLIGATLTIGAMAQDSARKAGMKDMRKDIRDVRADKSARAADIAAGNKAAAKAETKDIKADKKDIQSDKKTLQREGVKHPIRRAKKQIHNANVAKKNG